MLRRRQPHVILIAGPNGAGKSTIAPRVLQGTMAVKEFVNADVIARGLSGFDPAGVALTAGRLMLERLEQLASSRQNFAFETTLASRTFAPRIRALRSDGYSFHLIYLWLPSADQAIARVASRVLMGGHHVPDETVRRRYVAGIQNFFSLYRPIADSWRWYDNSNRENPRLIASGPNGEI